jgi:putative ABC transport system permease protein
MRSGRRSFRLFIACLALGVAAIAGILSFSRAVEEGLRADAREILGGSRCRCSSRGDARKVEFMKAWPVRALDRQPGDSAAGQPTAAPLVQLKAINGPRPGKLCSKAATSPMPWPSATSGRGGRGAAPGA